MEIKTLNKLIKDKKILARFIQKYEKDRFLFKLEVDIDEINGHFEKAEHNLRFISDNLKLKYFDWCVTGCYYAVYHASLALLGLKGWKSKHHNATLCILIKEFYGRGIEESDIELINKFFLTYNDLLFYAKSKGKRNEATYSTNLLFDKNSVKQLIDQARVYVNKVRVFVNEGKI